MPYLENFMKAKREKQGTAKKSLVLGRRVCLGLLIIVVFACQQEDHSSPNSNPALPADSGAVEVLQMDCPASVRVNEDSKLKLQIKTNSNEKIFYVIKEDNGKSNFKPNSGIIASREDVGKLETTLNSTSLGNRSFTLTLTNGRNKTSTRKFNIVVNQ